MTPIPVVRSLELHCEGPVLLSPADALPLTAPSDGRVHAWYAPLDRLDPFRSAWVEHLDPNERDRAERFRFARDRRRFELAHGLLRTILGHYLGRPPRSLAFERGPHGKPALTTGGLEFNLSDTKDAVLVGISSGQAIGADIETSDREVDHLAVGDHYFIPDEMEAIRAAGEGSKERFLLYWTRKEAILKASGVGIMEDLRSLRVDLPFHSARITHPEFMRMAAPGYHVMSLQASPTHVISLAMPGRIQDVLLLDAARLAP